MLYNSKRRSGFYKKYKKLFSEYINIKNNNSVLKFLNYLFIQHIYDIVDIALSKTESLPIQYDIYKESIKEYNNI